MTISHRQLLPGPQRFLLLAERVDGFEDVLTRLRVANAVQIEAAGGDRIRLEGPIEGHQGVDEQLAALRAVGGVMIPEMAVYGRQDRRIDDAGMVEHGAKHRI